MTPMMRALGLSVRNLAELCDGTYRVERLQGHAAQSLFAIGERAAGKASTFVTERARACSIRMGANHLAAQERQDYGLVRPRRAAC